MFFLNTLINALNREVREISDFMDSFLLHGSQIFCNRPEYLLTFVGLGMAIVILALAQTPSKLEDASVLKSKIYNRDIKYDPHIIIINQAKNDYWKFMTLIEKVGVLYFLSATLIAILITYPNPIPSPEPMGFMVLSNIAYLLLFTPTIIITLYYFHYRLFSYRLH